MPRARALTGELNRKSKGSGKQWSFMTDSRMKQNCEGRFAQELIRSLVAQGQILSHHEFPATVHANQHELAEVTTGLGEVYR